MWIRKTQTELFLEKKQRKHIANYVAGFIVCLYLWFLYVSKNQILLLLNDIPQNIDFLVSSIIFPIIIYAEYKGYINHGGFGWTSDRACLGCNKTWHRSHNGWGFMNFGNKKPKWYQFSHCQTPENCEVIGQHKVKWVYKSNT